MRGLTDLATMLAALAPELLNGEFVFCSLPEISIAEAMQWNPLGCFREPEGLTVILSRQTAEENNAAFTVALRCISLHVHSDLTAVGLTAAFANRLAKHGISANVVAGYYHDHIFVPPGCGTSGSGA